MTDKPLTRADLADALDAFWNSSIGHTRMALADTPATAVFAIASGIAAVAQTLREQEGAPPQEPDPVGQDATKLLGYANVYRDDDGDLELGAADVDRLDDVVPYAASFMEHVGIVELRLIPGSAGKSGEDIQASTPHTPSGAHTVAHRAVTIEIVREDGDHPVPSHGGLAVSITWILLVNGGNVASASERRPWEKRNDPGIEVPGAISMLFDNLRIALAGCYKPEIVE